MAIFRFKVYNGIGNVFTLGRMVGTREQVEAHCKAQLPKARKNSPCRWSYEIEEIRKQKHL